MNSELIRYFFVILIAATFCTSCTLHNYPEDKKIEELVWLRDIQLDTIKHTVSLKKGEYTFYFSKLMIMEELYRFAEEGKGCKTCNPQMKTFMTRHYAVETLNLLSSVDEYEIYEQDRLGRIESGDGPLTSNRFHIEFLHYGGEYMLNEFMKRGEFSLFKGDSAIHEIQVYRIETSGGGLHDFYYSESIGFLSCDNQEVYRTRPYMSIIT